MFTLLADVIVHGSTAELLVLNTCPRARGVGYQHGDRRGCLTGTREAILDRIETWTKDFNMSPVYWLNGLPGTGKSTIAQTTAERLFADGELGASFFCSRDFKDRGDLHLIFPTLSFQLAHRYPSFRSVLVPLLQSNPDIGHESLHSQMERLIVTPLKEKSISTVIVIDALDECADNEPQSAILSVMGRFAEEIPKVKFFITGRPEPRIQSGFRLKLLQPLTETFILHMVDHSVVNTDIQQFLKTELSELAHRSQLTGWPSDKHINLLCQRATGLFIYAVATVKFLDHKVHTPEEQLKKIINLPECTTYEGETQFKSNTTLDSLYTSILEMAIESHVEDPEADSKVQSTIGTVVLVVNPISPSAVAELIGLEIRQVLKILTLVQSLLILSEDHSCPVKPFHKSFRDFIIDQSRCLNKRFYISPSTLHCELTINCLRLMDSALKPNLLSLPNYALNREVKDLQDRVRSHISSALEYACKSWYHHLINAREHAACILTPLHNFLKEKFLPWLEVISVLGAARDVVAGLGNLVLWLQEVCLGLIRVLCITNTSNQVAMNQDLVNMARDYFSFVTRFFEVIKVSAPHIYHSALELSPTSSIIRKHYHCQPFHSSTPMVVCGLPRSWDQAMAISGKYGSCTWSPCGQSFSARTLTSVEVRDALTLEKHSNLQLTNPYSTGERILDTEPLNRLAYSLDGHSLAGCFGPTITIWDIQTGGVIKDIGAINDLPEQLVWSLDGTIIGAIFLAKEGTWDVCAYDVASGAKVSTNTLLSFLEPYLWPHGNSLQAFTILGDECSQIIIGILNIQPTSTNNLIESFPINLPGKPRAISFSPSTNRVSGITNSGMLFVFNIQNSAVMLKQNGPFDVHCLSPDGSLLVASAGCEDIYVWKYDPVGDDYYLLKQSPFWGEDGPQGYQISPVSSVLISRDSYLEVQHLGSLATNGPAENTHYDVFSTNGLYVVTASMTTRSTVAGPIKITNLVKNSSQFICNDSGVEGLALTGSILLVCWFDEIAGWRLTAEGTVDLAPDDGMGVYDGRLWTLPGPEGLGCFWAEGNIGAIEISRDFVFYYNTETGEEVDLPPLKLPLPPSHSQKYLDGHGNHLRDQCTLIYPHFINHKNPSDSYPPVSIPWYEDGWVKYPEGDYQHRFWLPAHWRPDWHEAHWLSNITTLRINIESGLVIIKF